MKTFAVALIATSAVAIQWGQNVAHTHYKDIKVNRPYTQDDSTFKTITNKKTRQQASNVTDKRTDTVYDDVWENATRDWLETKDVNRPQTVNSTSYSTEAVDGVQDRTRYDIVEEEYSSFEDKFVTEMKDVEIKVGETVYDDVTKIVNKTKEVTRYREEKKTRAVTNTIMVPVTTEKKVTKTRPEQETIYVDVTKTRPVTLTRDVEKTIYVDVEKSKTVTKTRQVEKTVNVDVEKTRDVEKTIYEDVEKTRDVIKYKTVTDTKYVLKTITIHTDGEESDSDAEGHGWGGYGQGHKTVTKKVPVTSSKQVPFTVWEKYTESVPKTITVQETYTVSEPMTTIEDEEYDEEIWVTVKEPKQVTETEEYQSSEEYTESVAKTITNQVEYEDVEKTTTMQPKEVTTYETYVEEIPYVDRVSVPTEVTYQVPRIVTRTETKQVAVQVVKRVPVTKTRKIAVKRIGTDNNETINAVRNDSSRQADKNVKVQSVVKQDRKVLRKAPREVEVERTRRVYTDVNADQSFEAKFQGTKTLNQELIRQQGLTHSHSNLSGNNPNLDFVSDSDSDSESDSGNDNSGSAHSHSAYSKGYGKW